MDLLTFTKGDQAVKLTTRLALVYCVVITIAFIASFFIQTKEISKITEKMLVIDTRGQVYNANSISGADARIYEYKNHIKMFYTYWYSFDENSFKEHIEAGLHLIGDRGKELLNEYNDEQVEKKLSEKNLRYETKITDIVIDMNTNPVSGRIEGIQSGKRARGSISRKLCARFTLEDVSRSEENLHGCKIVAWEIYESTVINENEKSNE